MSTPLRIANISGFYGDRLPAAKEMLLGGQVDVLTGDYLAELTMLILHKATRKSPDAGYAVTFLSQAEEILAEAVSRGVKIVVNAGGLNPAGLASEVKKLAETLGVPARVAHVEGDDILPRLKDLQARGHALSHLDRGIPLSQLEAEPLSANVYLGAWGIAQALERGADVVICPRVTDASIVVGPAAWHFGWAPDDWDRIASAVVAGHVIECGPQATGGNYAFFQEVPSLEKPGFPLAEMHEDGSFVVTKHPNTDGLVSRGTITAQLLYEIAEPAYKNPDVVARFDSIQLEDLGNDRVRVSGVRGEPRPDDLKVCINYVGGYRNTMTFVVCGLDIEEKARLAEETLRVHIGGAEAFDVYDSQLIRSDKADAATNDEASAFLKITVMDRDRKKVGRAFSNPAIHMLLASYPGIFLTTPPSAEKDFGVYWPSLLPAEEITHTMVDPDGVAVEIPHPPKTGGALTLPAPELPAAPTGPTTRVPLGTVIGARSGDKGGNANVGMWARSDLGYVWLRDFLTVEKFKELCPEAGHLEVRRFELPNLRALNFVVVGILGDGVASSLRNDPQAKSLGEFIRSRLVPLPEVLLADRPVSVR